ncbi:serine/threonine-protein kinase, partial [Kribbia dieselivorans]|uniref:serine/threonine-protein kinase n=1 Tax=Kribbia dieselivorans TaxID=331526 RepID=UPI00146FDB2A
MNRATDQRRRVVAPQVSGYRVGRLVGQGASSTVWEGTRSADGVKVALKVVAGGASSNGWRTEVEALRGVEHDHVVRLHDVIAAEPGGAGAAASAGVTGEPGSLVLVLDLLEGGDLGGVVRARGHLSPGECVTVLAPLAGALAHLHARGIVHGDLAPGNVLFDLAGRPSLADLGTAQVVGRRSRAQWGTPGFVAAELLAGGNPEPASDVYALAALGWFALTGDTPPEVGAQRAAREVLGDRVPEPLLAVLSACLSPDPAQRPDAVAAASGFFDAVPAEPLHLIHADGTAGLTRRIRESALAAAERAEARDSGVRDGGAGRRRGLFEDPVPMLEPDRREVRRRARVAQRRRRVDTVRRVLTSRVTLVSAGCAVVVVLGAVAAGGLWPSLTATPAISPTAQAAVSDQAVSDQA